MRDWENLRYFLSVARQGTVSGAAKELKVSHSTVLRRIEQFEKILDSKLFKRLQRGYELTSAGENLFGDSKDIEVAIDKALSKAEGHYDVTKGKLRISQPELGIVSTYPLYSEFQRQHPDITLEVHSTMETHNLNQQEVDIVLRFAETPPELLIGRCLGMVKVRIYASKNYIAKLPKNHTTKDYDWIVWQNSQETIRQRLAELNILNPHIVLYADSMPDIFSAVMNDMGVGFMSSHQAKNHPELVELFDGKVTGEHKLWILTHRDLRNSERVKTFMRFMTENLKLE